VQEKLFRGKPLDNQGWVRGYYYRHEPPLIAIAPKDYVPEEPQHYIAKTAFADWNMPRQVEFIQIDLATVGQYTGRKDKKNIEAFESDILCTIAGKAVIRLGEYGGAGDTEHYHVGFYVDFIDSFKNRTYRHELGYWLPQSEIIGNTVDNPELLGMEG
jgi:YopX protein.